MNEENCLTTTDLGSKKELEVQRAMGEGLQDQRRFPRRETAPFALRSPCCPSCRCSIWMLLWENLKLPKTRHRVRPEGYRSSQFELPHLFWVNLLTQGDFVFSRLQKEGLKGSFVVLVW